MILHIQGKINPFYVQTLCMSFFPGVKFPEQEEETPDVPVLDLRLSEVEGGVCAYARLQYRGQSEEAEKVSMDLPGETREKTYKLATGAAILAVGNKLLNYKPSWGILTGVRPAKVASDMLNRGFSKTRVKKILTSEYGLLSRKAALAVDVALNEQKLSRDQTPRDCSVYISIPFCPTRCGYCSFVSYTSKKLLSLIPDYLDKLCLDIDARFHTIERLGLNVRTIYIGGGTPTILDDGQLDRLLSFIEARTDVSRLEEYTLEAGRPDTVTAEKLRIAAAHGVTRTSVNPQSMNDEILCNIGRCHTADEFLKAYEIARNSNIRCINTDVIAGLPGDKFSTFSKSFEKVLSLHPENITVHTLAIKNASELRQTQNPYSMRGGDTGKCVDFYQLKSQGEGYVPYYMYRQKNTVGNFENVGYSIPGFEGRYNVYMMEEIHSILSAGAGAVTKLVDYRSTGLKDVFIQRLFNPKYPYEYLAPGREDRMDEEIVKFYEDRGMLN